MPAAPTDNSNASPRERTRPPRRGARLARAVVLTLALLGVIGLAAGAAAIFGGVYDISATEPHTRPVFELLELGKEYSVRRRSARIVVPPLDDARQRAQGLRLFADNCSQCHGAPGRSPEIYAQVMQPLPGPLTRAADRWEPQELFWIARHGLKMTGMPGWYGRLDDDELWAIVAFLQQLSRLSPVEYRHREADARAVAAAPARAIADDGRPDAALAALIRYGCQGCHVIPGIVGPTAVIGPPLERFGTRVLIAGRWPNTEQNLAEWVSRPQSLDPRTAMPDLGVSPLDAQLIARHLRAQR